MVRLIPTVLRPLETFSAVEVVWSGVSCVRSSIRYLLSSLFASPLYPDLAFDTDILLWISLV